MLICYACLLFVATGVVIFKLMLFYFCYPNVLVGFLLLPRIKLWSFRFHITLCKS
ncbi:hypothetical protein HanOQP8_Chr09g0330031 [Helianthus annuus]|nr:hypothetical protein HanOQP8_Chr09g0330031 [Helianthus annuus]